jgi:hypothetical protein
VSKNFSVRRIFISKRKFDRVVAGKITSPSWSKDSSMAVGNFGKYSNNLGFLLGHELAESETVEPFQGTLYPVSYVAQGIEPFTVVTPR